MKNLSLFDAHGAMGYTLREPHLTRLRVHDVMPLAPVAYVGFLNAKYEYLKGDFELIRIKFSTSQHNFLVL